MDRPEPKAPDGNPGGLLVGGFMLPDDGLLEHAPKRRPPYEKPDGERVGNNSLVEKPKRKRPHEKPSGFTTYEPLKPPSPLRLFVYTFGGAAVVCVFAALLLVIANAVDITFQYDPLRAIIALILFFCLLLWSIIFTVSRLG